MVAVQVGSDDSGKSITHGTSMRFVISDLAQRLPRMDAQTRADVTPWLTELARGGFLLTR